MIQPAMKRHSVEMKYDQSLSDKDVEKWMKLFQNQPPEFEDGAAHAE